MTQNLPVPKFTKSLHIEAFVNKIKLWSNNHGHLHESMRLQLVMDSLKENKERTELCSWIEHNIENSDFDQTKIGALDDFLLRFRVKFEVSSWRKAEDFWKEIINFKSEAQETTKQYLERFNMMEAKMRQMGKNIPDIFMAVHFIEQSKINELAKQNILARIDLNDQDRVLAKVKKAFEDLVTSLERETSVSYWTNREFQERRERRSEHEERGRDRQKREEKKTSGDWRDKSKRREERGGEERGRSRGREERGRGGEERGRSRGRSSGWQERGRSRGRSSSNYRSRSDRSRGPSSSREVYTCEKYNFPFPDHKEKEEHTVFLTETVNKCVVDSGCPVSVAGALWASVFQQGLASTQEFRGWDFKEKPEKEKFRFGPSQVYTSEKSIRIPVKLGDRVEPARIFVVNTNIPLLLGRNHLQEWRCEMDFSKKILKVKDDVKIKLDSDDKNHYTMDLLNPETEAVKVINNFYSDSDRYKNKNKTKEIKELSEQEKKEMVTKVHRVTAHKQKDVMIKFFRNTSKYDQSFERLISECIERCPTCTKFRKGAERPKVSLPKASDVNEVVSIDLKEMREEGVYILYMVDEFTKFTRGEVIKNKTPSAVIEALERNWIRLGPGYPSRGFFSDRGTEFCNKLVQEWTRKTGTSSRSTPAFSPWSNGSNERNHYTVDRTVMKLRDENPKMNLQEAVETACMWKNAEIRKSGFSSHQLVYGRGISIPGIVDGDVAIDSPVQYNEVAQVLNRHTRARQIHAQVDADNRLKAMMNERKKNYTEYKFQAGDLVYVKDRNSEVWEGPLQVHFHKDNDVTVITKQKTLNSVPIQRVRPYQEKREEEEQKEEEERQTDEEEEIEEGSHDIRPKKGKTIKFQLKENEKVLKGIVKQVGKKTSKDRNRCWIRFEDEKEESYDFGDEVSKWSEVKQVTGQLL